MSTHGYVKYNPHGTTEQVLISAKRILVDYEAWNSPLTVRQVFYRLVAEYSYDKTEQAYNSLVGYIARSRRAYQRKFLDMIEGGHGGDDARQTALEHPLLIPFSWIRDEKGQSVTVYSYDNVKDFLDTTKREAEVMKLNRQEGQPQTLELWCEANGMVPLMVDIADPYGIRVSSGGGYDSVTAKHQLAQRVAGNAINQNLSTVVLHIGDFDPSGEGMYETLRDDVGSMVWDMGCDQNELTIDRVALTEDQVIKMKIETAPPKPADSRRRRFVRNHPKIRQKLGTDDITAQLEALPPPELRKLVEKTIESYLDREAYEKALKKEKKARKEILSIIESQDEEN